MRTWEIIRNNWPFDTQWWTLRKQTLEVGSRRETRKSTVPMRGFQHHRRDTQRISRNSKILSGSERFFHRHWNKQNSLLEMSVTSRGEPKGSNERNPVEALQFPCENLRARIMMFWKLHRVSLRLAWATWVNFKRQRKREKYRLHSGTWVTPRFLKQSTSSTWRAPCFPCMSE